MKKEALLYGVYKENLFYVGRWPLSLREYLLHGHPVFWTDMIYERDLFVYGHYVMKKEVILSLILYYTHDILYWHNLFHLEGSFMFVWRS